MRAERGVSTINTALALSVSTLLLITAIPTALNFMTNTSLATEVQTAVTKVRKAAEANYALQLESTRCLAAAVPTITGLIAQSLLRAETVQGRPFTISLNYTQSNLGTWSRPTLLHIHITFQNQDDLQRAITGLQPSRRDSSTQLTFTSPISVSPDNRTWSNFNSNTGCFQ